MLTPLVVSILWADSADNARPISDVAARFPTVAARYAEASHRKVALVSTVLMKSMVEPGVIPESRATCIGLTAALRGAYERARVAHRNLREIRMTPRDSLTGDFV